MLRPNALIEHRGQAASVACRSYRTLCKYDSPSAQRSPIQNWRSVIAKGNKILLLERIFGVSKSPVCV
jgi:hypothetical protein